MVMLSAQLSGDNYHDDDTDDDIDYCSYDNDDDDDVLCYDDGGDDVDV